MSTVGDWRLQRARPEVPQFDAGRQAALYGLAVLTGDPPARMCRSRGGKLHRDSQSVSAASDWRCCQLARPAT